jgi:hypothetical protein
VEAVHLQGIPRPLRALALLLLAACATAPREEDAWDAPDAAAPELVGRLDGAPVTYGDVARYLRTKDPEAFSRSLEGLVLERVTRAEAEMAGITVPAPLLTRATERRMREWQERVREASRRAGGEEVDPALWLQRVAGVSMAEFRKWVARHTEVELLQDRLLRYELLTSPRVEVSILVVREEAGAAALARRLRDGADFAATARAESAHATASEGGRVPYPLVALDVNEPKIRDALFRAGSGEIVGPYPTRGGDETWFQVYRVEARREARRAPYAEMSEEITRGLESRPVHVGEYERWRRRILLRHGFVAARAAGEPE